MAEICLDAPKKMRVSWSRLKNWEACHHRTKLLIEKNRSKVIDGRVFLPGTLADRAMRAWLNNGKLTGKFEPGGMEEYLEGLWDDHTGVGAEYTIKWKGDIRKDKKVVLDKVLTCLRALEPILFEKVVPFPFQPEYRFTSTLGLKNSLGETVHVEVFGAVDVAVNYGEEAGYGLFDLKLTEDKAYIESTLGQLIFYAIAFRGHTGVWPKEFAFWAPLMTPKIFPIDVTQDDIRYMQSRIISYCHGVWAENWELTADETECFRCPTKHACPRWRNPIEKDEQGRNRLSFDRPALNIAPLEVVEGVLDV